MGILASDGKLLTVDGKLATANVTPSGPYMVTEYVAVYDGNETSHYIKRAKLYNHTAIYAYEFANQYCLQGLDFSDASNSITKIEENALSGAKLTGIVLPNTITTLQRCCCRGATITTLELPPLITELPSGAFADVLYALSGETGERLPINIILPPNLTKIGNNTFDGAQIKQIAIPDTVTEIGESAFAYCYDLESITLPPLLQKITNRMLSECDSLTAIAIPTAVTEIEQEAFIGSGLTSITIPSTVTTLGTGALTSCRNLTTINIQANVTEIPESFAEDSGRTSVTLPNTLVTIRDGAFASALANLTEITIPASVTTIEGRAFGQNGDMTTITCMAATPPTIGKNAFAVGTGTTIKVPAASVAAYKAAAGWIEWADKIVGI